MAAKIQVVSKTQFFQPDEDVENWTTDAVGGSAVIEFAGRSCYQSWSKPNPETSYNAGYIDNILDHRHFSVLEHATVGLYFQGVSRTLTHELIRHRHFSYSELSQRYVNMSEAPVVFHPTLAQFLNEDDFRQLMIDINSNITSEKRTYDDIVEYLKMRGVKGKKAREAARGIMPANLESKIVVTGNYRAWRHFLTMRASIHADAEIRELAVEVHDVLMSVSPAVFKDFERKETPDGILYLHSNIMEVG